MEFTQKYFEGNSAAHARAVYKGSGYDPTELNRRPHIGIANTFSENSPGHAHLRQLANAIKEGIRRAGFPLSSVFPLPAQRLLSAARPCVWTLP